MRDAPDSPPFLSRKIERKSSRKKEPLRPLGGDRVTVEGAGEVGAGVRGVAGEERVPLGVDL